MAGKELIQVLLDDGSLLELNSNMQGSVFTCLGTVQSRPLGIILFEKAKVDESGFIRVEKLLDKALVVGAPLLLILEEGAETNASESLSRFLMKLVRLSGVCPQLTLVIGAASDLAKAVAPYADFCFRAAYASSVAGCTLLQIPDLTAVIEKIRTLLTLLPLNCAEEAPVLDIGDELNRLCDAPQNASAHVLAKKLVDVHSIFVLYEDQHALIALARIGGRVTGMIAAADQAIPADTARFIRFCDCFSLPLVWLGDTLIPMQPQLVYALSEATNTKVLLPLGAAEHAGALFDVVLAPSGSAAVSCADDQDDMREMRRMLIQALELHSAKRDVLPPHKHGNMPLGGILI